MDKKTKILKKIGTGAKSITLGILDGMLAISENFLTTAIDRKHAYRIAYGYVENEWSAKRMAQFFCSLKRRGYIEVQKNGVSESIVLTEKAKMALIEQISSRLELDGKYRYISFDIPEQKKRQRNAFRRAIKKMGFRQVQRSLWVINKNVGDLVELAAYQFGVEKYIAYIIGEKSDIDGYIAKLFENHR